MKIAWRYLKSRFYTQHWGYLEGHVLEWSCMRTRIKSALENDEGGCGSFFHVDLLELCDSHRFFTCPLHPQHHPTVKHPASPDKWYKCTCPNKSFQQESLWLHPAQPKIELALVRPEYYQHTLILWICDPVIQIIQVSVSGFLKVPFFAEHFDEECTQSCKSRGTCSRPLSRLLLLDRSGCSTARWNEREIGLTCRRVQSKMRVHLIAFSRFANQNT